jgi:hypothetical protein
MSHTPSSSEPANNQSSHLSNHYFLIEGITTDGQVFRPSDWAERMSDVLSSFRGYRVIYSPLITPVNYQGNKCVVVDYGLEKKYPEIYKEILYFAESNHLRIIQNIDPKIFT